MGTYKGSGGEIIHKIFLIFYSDQVRRGHSICHVRLQPIVITYRGHGGIDSTWN